MTSLIYTLTRQIWTHLHYRYRGLNVSSALEFLVYTNKYVDNKYPGDGIFVQRLFFWGAGKICSHQGYSGQKTWSHSNIT